MSHEVVLTNKENVDFKKLIRLLDEDLNERYGELQKAYDKLNQTVDVRLVVLVYQDSEAVACGAFKEIDPSTVELKRIFVSKPYRSRGYAKVILNELEQAAKGKGYNHAILETGVKQNEAIDLYQKAGYEHVENYGPYVGNPNSVCMKKQL